MNFILYYFCNFSKRSVCTPSRCTASLRWSLITLAQELTPVFFLKKKCKIWGSGGDSRARGHNTRLNSLSFSISIQACKCVPWLKSHLLSLRSYHSFPHHWVFLSVTSGERSWLGFRIHLSFVFLMNSDGQVCLSTTETVRRPVGGGKGVLFFLS